MSGVEGWINPDKDLDCWDVVFERVPLVICLYSPCVSIWLETVNISVQAPSFLHRRNSKYQDVFHRPSVENAVQPIQVKSCCFSPSLCSIFLLLSPNGDSLCLFEMTLSSEWSLYQRFVMVSHRMKHLTFLEQSFHWELILCSLFSSGDTVRAWWSVQELLVLLYKENKLFNIVREDIFPCWKMYWNSFLRV